MCEDCLIDEHKRRGAIMPEWLKVYYIKKYGSVCDHLGCEVDMCFRGGHAASAAAAAAAAGAPPVVMPGPEVVRAPGVRPAVRVFPLAPRRRVMMLAWAAPGQPQPIKRKLKRKPKHHDFLRRSLRKPSHVTSSARSTSSR